ncbi:MAG: hypothetical protein JSW50_12435 [Candidatus Latescibacterota bacterium]|nr:MAG: hypothetical protein JSW50_12435 [Candidatus Latescibacterota bacterium]
MKKGILILLIALVPVQTAYAQGGAIVLSGDPQGSECNINDKSAGMCAVYVFHVGISGAFASQFAAPAPACFSGTWLSDTPVFGVTVGGSQTGVSIGYGQCTPGPIHILTINFFCQGMTQPCCYYTVQPHPELPSGVVEAVDCMDNLLTAKGGFGIFNSTDECECGPPTRDSTWGRVKSIFDE